MQSQSNHKTEWIIATSASDAFFPLLLNLIGSIKKQWPDHPPIVVYNIGLRSSFIRELHDIERVTVKDVPQTSPFWRSCYTWKCFIFKDCPTKTIYLDAGNVVLKPLLPIIKIAEQYGYAVVQQGATLGDIAPKQFFADLDIHADPHSPCVTAGVFAFDKNNQTVARLIDELDACAQKGLCLGFSPRDAWRNKGADKTTIVRDCTIFRHDTTLLSLLIYKHFTTPHILPTKIYAGVYSAHEHPEQLVWNLRWGKPDKNLILPRYELQRQQKNLIIYVWNTLVLYFMYIFKTFKKIVRINIGTDGMSKAFGNDFMDRLHDYASKTANNRLYHRIKASHVLSFMRKHANIHATFLDAGSGRGPYIYFGLPLFKKLYAFEFDKNELTISEANIGPFTHVTHEHVDLTNIPLKDQTINTIVCSEVLEHIPDNNKAAKELFRVLKPGGRALFSMPNRQSLFYAHVAKTNPEIAAITHMDIDDSRWTLWRHLAHRPCDIEHILTQAGFTVKKRTGANVLPLPGTLRIFFETKLPFGFFVYRALDAVLGKLLPRFGSFYFLEVTKP